MGNKSPVPKSCLPPPPWMSHCVPATAASPLANPDSAATHYSPASCNGSSWSQSVFPPHVPLVFYSGMGIPGEDAVTGIPSLQFQSERAVMQHHRLQVLPFDGLASETLHSQLDIHICLSRCMPCYTTTPAKGILLQPVNLGVCPNFRLATLSSAAAEYLQCLKSLCT